ncbi:DUF5067 domain-containing protein [Staphylococcus caprae]|uniref:DUF5067 domain-containing protein n=1 Tax=Staphylococcus caprae TaxID=29380 RepID=A0ABM7FTD1_9STAP|nr:DUF5067 domain-containing protein [Staphylococcus caprae]EES41334.1 hypothetical protein HMPREF0793_0958 [Staphylococcus caprae M23864:W1]MBN6826799.1 DUF5067 domain-containing protein [Staphylococcus caprae]MBX5316680.1 DUF5067 domain-containing protein [Staphylococcus caprae]MBX5318877.1 DUF5067 domain-containing protein [Staphylococcus caprae]MBX5323850.1 DUF5067 domain-containing protein [Staphylococcus caprae]
MKKLLGLLFASTLILGACGGHKDSSESDSSNKSSDSVSVDKSDDSEKTDSKFKNDKLTTKNYDVELKDAKILKASKYSDDEKPNLAVVYEVKNKTGKKDITANGAFLESFEGYQDSKNVKRHLYSGDAYDSELYEKYRENQDNEINKGGTVKGVKMYKLKDTKTPVTLEVKDPDGLHKKLGEKEIKLK